MFDKSVVKEDKEQYCVMNDEAIHSKSDLFDTRHA